MARKHNQQPNYNMYNTYTSDERNFFFLHESCTCLVTFMVPLPTDWKRGTPRFSSSAAKDIIQTPVPFQAVAVTRRYDHRHGPHRSCSTNSPSSPSSHPCTIEEGQTISETKTTHVAKSPRSSSDNRREEIHKNLHGRFAR